MCEMGRYLMIRAYPSKDGDAVARDGIRFCLGYTCHKGKRSEVETARRRTGIRSAIEKKGKGDRNILDDCFEEVVVLILRSRFGQSRQIRFQGISRRVC